MNELKLIELFWNVNKGMGKRLAPLMRKVGLTPSELIALHKVHHRGSCRVTFLAEQIGVPPSTLTGMLDRLVEAGLLERGRDPEDRRAVVMHGTEKLNKLLRHIRRTASMQMAKTLHRLPQDLVDRLSKDLERVTELMEQWEKEE